MSKHIRTQEEEWESLRRSLNPEFFAEMRAKYPLPDTDLPSKTDRHPSIAS